MRKVLAGMVAMLMLMTSPAWAECLSADAPVSGELWILETRHPAGHLMRAPKLLFPDGGCVSAIGVEGDIEDRQVRDVHIVFSSEHPVDVSALLGEHITVKGAMSVSHTAWHLGSVVMFDAQIVEHTQ